MKKIKIKWIMLVLLLTMVIFEIPSQMFGTQKSVTVYAASVDITDISIVKKDGQSIDSDAWSDQDVKVSINVTDSSNVQSYHFSTDEMGGENGKYVVQAHPANSYTISEEGETTLYYFVTDKDGVETKRGSVTVKIDKTLPAMIVVNNSEEELQENGTYSKNLFLSVSDNNILCVEVYKGAELIGNYDEAALQDSIILEQEENPCQYHIVLKDLAGNNKSYEFTMEAFIQNIEVRVGSIVGVYGDDMPFDLEIKNTNTVYQGANSGDTTAYEGQDKIILNDNGITEFISGDVENFVVPKRAATKYFEIQPQTSENFQYIIRANEPGTYRAVLKIPYMPTTFQDKWKTIELTGVVNKRSLTNVSLAMSKSKVYDGTTTVADVGAVSFENAVEGDEVSVTASAVYDNAEAGTGKTITITYVLTGADAYKYETPEAQVVTDAEIIKAEGTAAFEIKDIYFGENIDYSVSSSTNGADNVTFAYKKTSEISYKVGVPTEEGTYDIKAIFAEVANYKEVTVTKSFTIGRLAASSEMYQVSGTLGKNEWYTTPITVSGKGDNLISLTENGTYGSQIVINKSGNYQIYIKTSTGATTEAVTLPAYKIDETSPKIADGEGIVMESTGWQSFLEKVTFGIYKKTVKTGSISAHDNESGILEISYYISDKTLSYQQVQAITDFTVGDTFTIGSDTPSNYVVYAKIENNAGLITWISSDGVVIDNIAPVISGVEDGKTYDTDSLEITVTDYCLGKVELNNKTQTIKNNETKLTIERLENDTEYTLTATDKCGNSSEYKFTLKGTNIISGIGKQKLSKGIAYQLQEGKWRVSGDNTVYEGGIVFYVNTDGEYEFIEE